MSRPPRASRFPKIPGYQIESVIGRGATGVVYRAQRERVGRDVALKVLHPELASQPRVVQRLQREARTTARLAHPHLVTAVDMGEADGQWWYAMEYVDGSSLSLRLREEGRLKEREALRLFIPLCEALEHLWEQGVVHRDIKPANILIDRRGGARLADLGLAFDDEDDEELTKTGGTLGTPAYISPEQAVDPRDADVQSDIWSFGAALFHAVCGRPPFRAESAAEVLSCVLYARVPHPQELESSLTRGLSLVLRKCLTRDREIRYQTPSELLEDLERVRERRSPKIRRGQLDPVQRRYDPRATWAVVAAIVLVLGGALAWAFGWGRGPGPEDDGTVETAAVPHAPLEEIAGRLDSDPSLLAQIASELESIRTSVPAANRGRFEEVRNHVRGRLRAQVRVVTDLTQKVFDQALADENYVLARSALEEGLRRELLDRTGHVLEDAATEPTLGPLSPWRTRLLATLDSAEGAALGSLATSLEALREMRFARAERMVEIQEDWQSARGELLVDGAQLLADAGFTGIRFPAADLSDVLDPVLLAFEIRRQRFDDDWVRTDNELRRAVIAHSDRLERDLAETGKRYPPASEELAEAFNRLLGDLTPAKMPEGLAHAAVAEFEKRLAALVRLEDRALEVEARNLLAATERMTDIQWRGREYLSVLGIWETFDRGLQEPGGVPDAEWRKELMQTASLRREEARRLRVLLEVVAERIVALNGRPVDLWVDGIQRENRRVTTGVDPLADGFRIQGLAQPLSPRTITTADLERLAGVGDPVELDPEARLLVALLRSRDGDFEGAQQVLRAGELPMKGISWDLALDLSVRVSEALLLQEDRAEARGSEARRLLALATNPERIEREPRLVVLWIDELLEKYEDVPEVEAQRASLLTLRERVRPGAMRARPRDEDYARELGPTKFVSLSNDRVRLEYDFVADTAGAWSRGDWVFDTRGWSPDPSRLETSFASVQRQNGPSLILKWPLDAGAGEIEVTLTIEQPAEPTRLLTISAAGFHVGFVGTHLPGEGADHRLMVSSGTFADFLSRLQSGEGRPRASLLRRAATHEITLRANSRSGKVTVLLDGDRLGTFQLPRPDLSAATIVVRAMERVTLHRATIQAPR